MLTKHESILELTKVCLEKLIEDGMVKYEDVAFKWDVRVDSENKLKELGMSAATTLEGTTAVLVYPEEETYLEISKYIPHEVIHIAQICKGDFVPGLIPEGKGFWKGKEYLALATNDPNYFDEDYQPWEHEAQSLEGAVKEYMHKEYPVTKSS